MSEIRLRYPIWTRGDLDGFFGLMVDNLVQVLLIFTLCTNNAGIPAELVWSRILPGVAVSLLIGNLFYGLQAHFVARRTHRADTTALPFGINTPSVIAYALFIIAPVYHGSAEKIGASAAADLAWKAGLMACIVSGAIEFFGAFFAEHLRRITPRAALLGVLTAVGITFIASDFAFRIYAQPAVGLFPLFILLLAYFAHYRFPYGLPGGFLAVLVGAAAAWLLSTPLAAHGLGTTALMSPEAVADSIHHIRWTPPIFSGNELLAVFSQQDLWVRFLTVSVPMGLLNVLGSLQNIESAAAAGDHFRTGPSLAVNGLGTIAAALFGSCFPTTIYIGHPAWKALGARSGYSILNGFFFTVCFLLGLGPLLASLIPIEAGAAIVMFIGIVITAQSFQATPREHAPAVALALFPALAAMLIVTLPLYMIDASAGRTLGQMVATVTSKSAVPTLPGMLALTGANSSWLVTTPILAAIGVFLIERRFRAAAAWCSAATILTGLGLLHAYRIDTAGIIHEFFLWQRPDEGDFAYRATPIAVAYGLATLLFALAAARQRSALRNQAGQTALEQVAAQGTAVKVPAPRAVR